MAKQLTSKDSIRDWIRKVNAIVNLKTVDGTFALKIDEEVLDPITVNIGEGRIRVASDSVYIPAKTITLDPASTYRVGVNTLTSEIAKFKLGTVPNTGFIPVWEMQTNSVSVSKVLDLRTWAQEGSEVTEGSLSDIRDDLDAAIAQSQENADRILAEANARTTEIQELTTKASQNAQDIIAEAQAREAAIGSEVSARQDADSALSTRIDTVVATANNNAAAIVTEQTARADGDSALSQEIGSLAVTVGDNTSLIQTEQTARANADSALASDISTLSTSVDDNAAAIVTEQNARASEDLALSNRIDSVVATVDDNAAAIVAEQNARASQDFALSQQINTVSASVDDNAAAIEQEQIARADADSAIASDVSTLSTTVDGNTATISTFQSSIDGLEAQYVLTVEANGTVSGVKLAAGPEGSSFIVRSDRFAIIDPTGTPGTDDIVPFEVSGGVVTIPTLEVNQINYADGSIDLGGTKVTGTISGDNIEEGAIVNVTETTSAPDTQILTGNDDGTWVNAASFDVNVLGLNSAVAVQFNFSMTIDMISLSEVQAGPGGPTIKLRIRRGASTIVWESDEVVVSGSGYVTLQFGSKIDSNPPQGLNTYTIEIYWEKGFYDAGTVSFDVNYDVDGRAKIANGTEFTFDGSFLATYVGVDWTIDIPSVLPIYGSYNSSTDTYNDVIDPLPVRGGFGLSLIRSYNTYAIASADCYAPALNDVGKANSSETISGVPYSAQCDVHRLTGSLSNYWIRAIEYRS